MSSAEAVQPLGVSVVRHLSLAIVALALGVIAAGTSGAFAQSAFKTGQSVKPSDGPAAEACATKDDLKTYQSVGGLCAFGDAASCNTIKELETKKICGPRDRNYVVISLDADGDLMQIAPANDKTKTYWAHTSNFNTAK
jgi:hypothetical protein